MSDVARDSETINALRLALECMRHEYHGLEWTARPYTQYRELLTINKVSARRAHERRRALERAMEHLAALLPVEVTV